MATTSRRQTQRAETPTDYVLAIRQWGWSYAFRLNSMRREPDPFMEFRHRQSLRVTGEAAEVTGLAFNGQCRHCQQPDGMRKADLQNAIHRFSRFCAVFLIRCHDVRNLRAARVS